MNLKIITHERIVFDNEVDELVVQTTSGQIGVLKDHIPITTPLEIGVTKAKIGEKFKYFATMGGVFQFKDNNAVILTDVCEDGSDIDIARANAAKERAEARLAEQKAELDEILKQLDREDVSVVMQSYLKMIKQMIHCVVNCLDLLDDYLAGKLPSEDAEAYMRGQIAGVTVVD